MNLGILESAKIFLRIVPKSKKNKIYALTAFQVILSFFELFGLLVLTSFVALAAQNAISQNVDTSSPLKFIDIATLRGFSNSHLFALLGLGLILIFVIKSLLSIYVTNRVMSLMGEIASDLSRKIFEYSILNSEIFLATIGKQKRVFTMTRGVDYWCLFVMAPLFVLAADLTAIIVLGVGILVVDPSVMLVLSVTALFTTVFVTRNLQSRSGLLGKLNAETNVQVNETIFESLDVYRELTVRDARKLYVERVGSLRSDLALNTATFNTLPYISKYIMELSILFAGACLALYQVLLNDLVSALSSFVLFTVVTARVTPLLLRAQQGLVSIRGNIGNANSTIEFVLRSSFTRKQLEEKNVREKVNQEVSLRPNKFVPRIELSDVYFSYHQGSAFNISKLNLKISPGEKIALVGPSGSGKTTLVDLILGIYKPSIGKVQISALDPIECFHEWPGKVQYVPQVVGLIKGSIRDNLLIGLERAKFPDGDLKEALVFANLWDLIQSMPKGLDTEIGENGLNLSVGQRQRLGIARARVSRPELIILDEATSALDAESEELIMRSMNSLSDKVTTITVAHRLSTVQSASCIIYMDSGKVIAQGTFQELRVKVPNFDKQASLLGL